MREPFFAVKFGSWDCYCLVEDRDAQLQHPHDLGMESTRLLQNTQYVRRPHFHDTPEIVEVDSGADTDGGDDSEEVQIVRFTQAATACEAALAGSDGRLLRRVLASPNPLNPKDTIEAFATQAGGDTSRRSRDDTSVSSEVCSHRSGRRRSTKKQTWKPQLPNPAIAEEDWDPEAQQVNQAQEAKFDWRDLPFAPVLRRKAGEERKRARDRWNFEELRLGDTLAKGDYTCAEGLRESDFRAVLNAVWGDQLEEEDFQWTLLLATRGQRDRPVNLQELHYAMRAWHGLRSLPRDALRTISLIDLGLSRTDDDVEASIVEVLESLNGDLPVSRAEARLVMGEAAGIAAGHLGRPQLLRAIGAWYANVQRTHTSWASMLGLYSTRVVGASEYHIEILFQLSKFAPDQEALRGEPRTRRLPPPLTRSFATQVATDAAEPSASPVDHVMRVAWAVVMAAVLLVLLVFPTFFFSFAIYMGCVHGSDECPKDLDALFTWFGILGVAALVVDCAEGALAPTAVAWASASGGLGLDHAKENLQGTISIWTSLVLRLLLAVFPWIGTSWTFKLSHEDQATCGYVLWNASALWWPSLLLLELAFAFHFCWGFAVMTEHEISLRQVLEAPEPAARSPTVAARRQNRRLHDGNRAGEMDALLVESEMLRVTMAHGLTNGLGARLQADA